MSVGAALGLLLKAPSPVTPRIPARGPPGCGKTSVSGAEQFEHTAKSVFAVTGGTGRYSGADGHVTATVRGATATPLTFHLDR